ncbi:hypothetical protein FS749_008089, partial [Ceratobasidium sp. UAMH 11750]
MISFQVKRPDAQSSRIFKNREILTLICSFSRVSDCARLSRTCKTVFKVSAAFVWKNVDGAQHLLSLLGATQKFYKKDSRDLSRIVIGTASSSSVDFSRFDIYAPYVRILRVYGPGNGSYYRVEGWKHLAVRTQQRLLLPRLSSIVIQSSKSDAKSNALLWIKTFISPSLRSIQVVPDTIKSPPCVSLLM